MPIIENIIEPRTTIRIWKIDETINDLFEQIKELPLSIEHLNGYNSEGRKKQWLASRLLLKEEILNKHDTSLQAFSNGKPYLKTAKKEVSLSLSHTAYYSSAAIGEVAGTDIEQISERIHKIKNRFASDKELSFCSEDTQLLITLWSAKESIFKQFGGETTHFKKNIHVENVDADVIKATATPDNRHIYNVLLKSKMIDDHILTYISDFYLEK